MARLEMKQRCAEMRERARIARELHDTVLQAFTGATLLLQAVARDLRYADSPSTVAAANALDNILGLTDHALEETRRAIMNLRTAMPADGTFADRLELLLHQILGMSSVPFHFERAGVARHLGNEAEQHMLRICQEALTNVVRHAKAGHVAVALSYNAECLCVLISDDGGGFRVNTHSNAESGHFGLIGMHERATLAGGERATLAGGRLSIVSTEARGTSIVLTVPYATSHAELFVA